MQFFLSRKLHEPIDFLGIWYMIINGDEAFEAVLESLTHSLQMTMTWNTAASLSVFILSHIKEEGQSHLPQPASPEKRRSATNTGVMINQPRRKIKSFNIAFMQEELEILYKNAVNAVADGSCSIVLACCQVLSILSSFIFYGTYPRDVLDVVAYFRAGKVCYKVCKVKLSIQRIKCVRKGCKTSSTHALLFDFFVPYGHYSVRFILYYLNLYFNSNKSIEAFCLEYGLKLFSEKTFRKWLIWYDEHIDLFSQMGIVGNPKEKRKIREKCYRSMISDIGQTIRRTLRKINRSIFQTHLSPSNTHYTESDEILKTA